MMSEQRVDKLLCDQGLVASRAQAQKLIQAQAVQYHHNGHWQTVAKPSLKLNSLCEFKLTKIDELRYVSRAGLKLEKALEYLKNEHQITGSDFPVALDIGQSTGGFTDCLLQWGVEHVVGIDVGHSQLAERLKNHPQVTCYEGINAREIPAYIREPFASKGFNLIVMDVSFVSQLKIISGLTRFICSGGYLITLIKPQFEVGKHNINKNGLVKSPELHQKTREKIIEYVENVDIRVKKVIESPILGGDGNKEMLLIGEYCPQNTA